MGRTVNRHGKQNLSAKVRRTPAMPLWNSMSMPGSGVENMMRNRGKSAWQNLPLPMEIKPGRWLALAFHPRGGEASPMVVLRPAVSSAVRTLR